MLKIHKLQSKSKLLLTLGITSVCIIFGLLALGALTYTPELSHAEMVTYRSLDDITYMQEMTASICKASSENATKQLVDSRDGKSYWVTKLKDGNCWMTQNLDYDLKTTEPLTPADSNVSNKWTPPSDTQISAVPKFTNEVMNVVQSWDPAQGGLPTYCNDGGEAGKCKTNSNSTISINGGHDAQGNYYSWGAATAGQAVSLTSDTDGQESTQSICPRGWRLPFIGSEGNMAGESFYGLVNETAVEQVIAAPYYFVYGGLVIPDYPLQVAGSNGRYWSSTASGHASAQFLQITTSFFFGSNARFSGFTLRCVASTERRKTLSDLTYMQDMTMEVCANSAEDETKQLIDSRDSKKYWVTKLKDDNCWMTQNLDLDIPASGLSKNDTDIPEDWNASTNRTFPPVATQKGDSPWGFSGDNVVASWDPAQGGAERYCSGSRCGSISDTSSNGGHDAQGNYYSWNAATAGTGASVTAKNTNASGSICPKGWKLPQNQPSTIGAPAVVSYRNLLDHYGWSWNKGYDPDNKSSTSVTGIVDGIIYNIVEKPLYFVRSGFVHDNFPQILNPNSDGRYWSSTASDVPSTYYMYFGNDEVDPSFSIVRYLGYPVRCVAPGGERLNYNNVEIMVNPTISIDLVSEVEIEKGNTSPSAADLNVKVASNQLYSVSINAKDSAELTSTTSNVTIPSNGGSLTTAVNNWGIMKPNESTYAKVTTSPELFYQATAPEVKDILFKIGISTAPDLPNGEYSTDITVTATQN